MTQQQLADRAGLSRQTVSYIEGGRIEARITTLLGLCAVLRIHVSQLIGGRGGGSPAS